MQLKNIRGKLRKIDLQGKTYNDFMNLWIERNRLILSHRTDEDLKDEFFKRFYLGRTDVFEFVEKTGSSLEPFCHIKENEDGTYSFHAFYDEDNFDDLALEDYLDIGFDEM